MPNYQILLRAQTPIDVQSDSFNMYTQYGVTICEFHNCEYTEESKKRFFSTKEETVKTLSGYKKILSLAIPSPDHIIVKEI